MADEYHEPWEKLSPETRDFHRALKSLQEELEAVDWYHQRASLCKEDSLRQVIEHNRDEEMEHASMLLEWLRRNMPGWEEHLRGYLFTEKPLLEIEEELEKADKNSENNSSPSSSKDAMSDLGIGDMKEDLKP